MTDPTALVNRIRNGDVTAEDELVYCFHRDVLRLLHGRMRDREAARELADDVLMAVVCALRNGRLHDAEKLRAFVRGTARNVANNYLRARSAHPREEPLPADTMAPESPDSVEQREKWA